MLRPATDQAYRLLHEGTIAMARMESYGIRVDVSYLTSKIQEVKQSIIQRENALQKTEEYKLWAKHFGQKMKLDAAHQLGKIIFDLMGNPRNPHIRDTKRKGVSNAELAFEHLVPKVPFLKSYFAIKKLRKALSTNLIGLLRETVNGRVHPHFHLHSVESYRGSSSDPNLQNQAVRNKQISEIVRTCFIPDPSCVFIEMDYSTQEVRVSYCYHKDPGLLHDILTGDMHRDRAMDLYLLSPDELGDYKDKSKPGTSARYCAKNKFVFPQFYGSVYAQCAPNLWDAISQMKLTTAQGISLFEHLASKGITKLGACDYNEEPQEGTFELHVKQVERKMWEESYPVYGQWKKDWWDQYLRDGGVNTLTGFKQEGIFRRNQILCDCIQGSAFHCLLWTIIEKQKEIIRRKMKSRVVCQIHDSSLAVVPEKEVDDYVHLAKEIATERIAKAWRWITCPLSVEFERCDQNWYQKKGMEV